MAPPTHSSGGPLPPGSGGNPTHTPLSSDSSANNHQRQNAVNVSSNGGAKVHPPMHERSRNARAQARHRAKRKAYIEQLEETVARLQAALSPYPPFGSGGPSSGVNGSANASPNDQSQTHSSFGISLSSPGSIPNSSTNPQVGLGSSPASGQGQGSTGVDPGFIVARSRALESECNALRQYAETIRGLLTQHAPSVQIPPAPLPSSLPAATLTAAASSGPPSLHSGANPRGTPTNGTLPPLNSSHPSFMSAVSSTSMTSFSPGAYKMGSSEKVTGIKRPRRDSLSQSISDGRSDVDDEQSAGIGEGANPGYSTPNPTPPLTNKNASSTPIHSSFTSGGINSLVNSNTASRTGVPPLTLPPVSQSQSSPGHPSSGHPHTHPTPPAYTSASNAANSQSQQQPLSPLHQQSSYQHQTPLQTHAHAHTSANTQPPQMTPMPPPIPWGGNSSVPSHGGNNGHAHGLHLPPPVPRFTGTQMPNLTRSFVYPLSSSSGSSTTRQDGIDSGNHPDRSRVGSFAGSGIGTGLGNAGVVLKREEDPESSLPTGAYGQVGSENAYSQPQTPRHGPGRHQQHESIHSISPTSATAPSHAVGFSSSSQYQQQQHTQLPSPHVQQQNYQHQQAATAPRPLTSLLSQQHQPLTQNHYHHTESHHQSLQAPQHHQTQNQQGGGALPSPHSPYSPIGPNAPGQHRGYPEERYQQQQAHVHQQGPQVPNQNHNQNYMWSPAQTNSVYGGR